MSQIKSKEVTETDNFDWKSLDALLQYKPTLDFCADYMRLSGRTIERKIIDKHKMTFSEYRSKRMAFTKVSLIQKAIEMALKGHATMLIFCLKNLCDWSDKVENRIEEVPTKELIEHAKEVINKYEKEHEPITN